MNREIAIVGGGIAGLTTALALQKMGLECKVYERSPELNEVGAGIMMQPNALKVLDWLGVGEEIRASSQILDEVQLTKCNLQPIRRSRLDKTAHRPDQKIASIHRGKLQGILSRNLHEGSLCLDEGFERLENEGNRVRFRTRQGWREADLLLGADGLRSQVRQELWGNTELRYSGQTCWRGVVDMDIPAEYAHHGVEAWGRKCRFGFAPIGPNTVYWFAVTKAPERQQDDRQWLKNGLLHRHAKFHSFVGDLISETIVDNIIRHDLHDLKRLEKWSANRVCLIGDAAHATTPNMGQGGGQGVEDAFYMARLLARHSDHRQAFSEFESMRRPKVDYVVNTSWRFGQLAHQRVGRWLAMMAMRWTPERVMQRQIEKLYNVKIDGWES